MKKFGLIGNPISASKSPALFNAGYHGRYSYDLIEEEEFGNAWKRFTAGYDGINVTAPFKLDAFGKADILCGLCGKLGAANLILKTDKGIAAYNTDFPGIILSLLDAAYPEGGHSFFLRYGEDFRNASGIFREFFGHKPKALVAGCGGAGRAAAAAAAATGCETVLVNRSSDKARKIASDMTESNFTIAGTDDFPELFSACDIIIYTIPGPIAGIDGIQPCTDRKILLEANYKDPSFDAGTLCRAGEKCIYVSGRRWLLYQALTGFSIFTGENPDFAGMCKVI